MANCRRGEWEDIGHDVRIRRAFIDERLAGVDYEHPAKGACNGKDFYIPCAADGIVAEKHWRLHSEQPLTLSPSLPCPVCGHHGFIRDGKWVPA